jgi:hypothetical protein
VARRRVKLIIIREKIQNLINWTTSKSFLLKFLVVRRRGPIVYNDFMTWYADWHVDLDRLKSIKYIVISIFIKKNHTLNIYFESNYIFIGHPDYLWTCQDDQVTSDQFSLGFNFFPTRKQILATPRYFYINFFYSTCNVAQTNNLVIIKKNYVHYLINIFQCHLSTLSWSGIRLYNFFRFVFYNVMLVFWPRFVRLTQVIFSLPFSFLFFSI